MASYKNAIQKTTEELYIEKRDIIFIRLKSIKAREKTLFKITTKKKLRALKSEVKITVEEKLIMKELSKIIRDYRLLLNKAAEIVCFRMNNDILIDDKFLEKMSSVTIHNLDLIGLS